MDSIVLSDSKCNKKEWENDYGIGIFFSESQIPGRGRAWRRKEIEGRKPVMCMSFAFLFDLITFAKAR